MRRLTILLSCVLQVVWVAYVISPSEANWFAPSGRARSVNEVYACGGGNITDDKDVSFAFDPDHMIDETRNAVNWTRNNLLEGPGTGLTTNVVANPGAHIDVYVIARAYTDWCEDVLGVQWTTDGIYGLLALQNCETKSTDNARCDKANTRFSTLFFGAWAATSERWLVCHEVGHAIGLKHRNVGGCMENCGVSSPEYKSHDVNHFAANWSQEPESGENNPSC